MTYAMSRTLPIPVRRPPDGFTLVEMVMSLTILSVLLLACGSIVGMATRATGDTATRNVTQLKAADAVGQITDDLNVALNFTQRTSTAVTFTVPDRLSVGTPQVVSYQWSGTPGDPLTRQFNGGTAATVLSGVQSLNLSFVSRLMGPEPDPVEQDIASHATVSGSLNDFKLEDKHGASQYFHPSLPLGTTAYTLTRVRMRLKSEGAPDGVITVSIRLPDAAYRPTGVTLAQATLHESALSGDYEWVDVPISGLANLNPMQGLCIVLENAAGTKDTCKIETDESASGVMSTAFWSKTTNSGTSWSAGTTTICARFTVLGTVP